MKRIEKERRKTSDYIYVFDEIIDITSSGLILKCKKTNIIIKFDDCAKNHANENHLETSKCVATRDITKLTFTFYTNPKIRLVFKKSFIKDLLLEKSAVDNFEELQDAINKYGYTSYDLS